MLDKVNLLGPVQLVLERLQHVPIFDAKNLEGNVAVARRLVVDQEHNSWANLDLVNVLVVYRVQVRVILEVPNLVHLVRRRVGQNLAVDVIKLDKSRIFEGLRLEYGKASVWLLSLDVPVWGLGFRV